MTTRTQSITVLIAALGLAAVSAACGEVSRQGRSPSQIVINSLEGASGATPDEFGHVLFSDVITTVRRTVGGQQVDVPTIFADLGQVTMSIMLKDPGQLGVTTGPSAVNQITFTRYRVTYRRSDGRNTPGVDVPYPVEGSATFTVPADGTASASFELVRHTAKSEAPLLALQSSGVILTTIADVSFYGRDQAGNDVAASGSIQVNFGNFGDPS